MEPRPLWWDAAPRPDLEFATALPSRTDVAVIGGGYTGVSAAYALALTGAQVTVLERDTLGSGASTRNWGFVQPGFAPDARTLIRRLGAVRARELYVASRAAVRFVEDFLEAEDVDCEYARSGHLTLAARPAHYAELEREAEVLHKVLRHEAKLVPASRLGEELAAATTYSGALLDASAGGVNPGKLFWALATSAARAGVTLVEHTTVQDLRRSAGRFMVRTSRGALGARDVVLAADGSTEGVLRGLRRRVARAGSFVIATAPLGPSVARALIPRDRVISDPLLLPAFFRITGDTRMLFGGAATFGKVRLQQTVKQLVAAMFTLFPRLLGTDVDYYWSASSGVTRDRLPHAGVRDGVHFAAGYSGHGLALAIYLGAKLGQVVAGGPKAELEPFVRLPFPALPLLHRLKNRNG